MFKLLQYICVAIFGFFVFTIISPWGLRVNTTDSLPYSLFISSKIVPGDLNIGSVVAFEHPSSKRLIAKQIIGFPGDLVYRVGENICLNGVCVGKALSRSPSGMALTSVESEIIPEGFFFVFAPHELSFDSRYAEFGFVSEQSIKEVLWALF